MFQLGQDDESLLPHAAQKAESTEGLTKRRSLGNDQIQTTLNSLFAPNPNLERRSSRKLSRGATDAFQQVGGKSVGLTVLSTKLHVQKLLNNVMSKNHLKELLQKPYKSPMEAEFILRRIERMKFFQSFMTEFLSADYNLLIDFCSHLRHEWHPQGTVIIKQGDFSSDKMYVILTGTVSVYRRESFAIVDMNSHEEKKSGKSPLKKKKEHSELEAAHGTYIKDLVKEEGFGERALLQKIRRMATIVAKTDVDFLVINKEDFQKIKATFSKAHELRVQQILKSLPVLKSKIVSSSILDHLMFFFEEEKITRSNLLTKQGERYHPAEKIYIIHQGEFVIEKEIDLKDLRSMEYKVLSLEEIVMNKTELPPCRPLKIAVVGKGMVLGEEIVMPEHKGTALYTIKCVSQEATVLSLQKSVLYSKFPKFLVDFLRELYATRQKQRNSFYEEFLRNMILNKNFFTPVIQHGPNLRKKIEIDEGFNLETVKGLAFRKNFESSPSTPKVASKNTGEPQSEPRRKMKKITSRSNFKEIQNNESPSQLIKTRPQTQSTQFTSASNLNSSEPQNEISKTPVHKKENKSAFGRNDIKMDKSQTSIHLPSSLAQKENQQKSRKNNYIVKFDHKVLPKSINNRVPLGDENEENQSFKRIQKNFLVSPKQSFNKLLNTAVETGSDRQTYTPISQPTASTVRRNSNNSEDEILSNSPNEIAEENATNENNIKANIKRMRDLEIGDEKRMFRQDRYLKAKMIKCGLIKTEDFTPKATGIKSCGDFLRKLNYQKYPSDYLEAVINIKGTSTLSAVDFSEEHRQEPKPPKEIIRKKQISFSSIPPRQETFTQNLHQKKEMRKKLKGLKTHALHNSNPQALSLQIGKLDTI